MSRLRPLLSILTTLLTLTTIALLERVIFAIYHSSLSDALTLVDMAMALLWGVRLDLALCSALTLMVCIGAWLWLLVVGKGFNRAFQLLTMLAIVGLIALHGGDLLYFEEAGRHLGYELLESFNSANELALSAVNSYPFAVAMQLTLMAIAVVIYRYIAMASMVVQPPVNDRFAVTVQILLLLPLFVVLIRGGVQPVPLEPLHAQEIGDSRKATLALNGAYNALFSSLTPYTVTRHLTTPPNEDDLARIRQLYSPPQVTPREGIPPHNVIIILLESWSAPYLGSYGHSESATPFFDSLRHQGLTTDVLIAGGTRTTEGLFTTLCSAQNPLGQTVAQSQLQQYDYQCLPHLLAERGYQSAFFQGSNKDTSGTGLFARQLGFQQSFGKGDIKQRRYPTNSWGVHDPDLYNHVLSYIDSNKGPQLIGINTNSTHDSHLPPSFTPPFAGTDHASRYLNVLNFADTALADFIATLEQRGILERSLLVLVADHGGGAHHTVRRRFEVPFVIFGAGITTPRWLPVVASQRDIAPTITDLLGVATPSWFTGYSLMQEGAPRIGDYFYQGWLGWSSAGATVEFRLNDSNTIECYPEGDSGKDSCRNKVALVADAIAFGRLSQELLFSGRSREFGTLVGRR